MSTENVEPEEEETKTEEEEVEEPEKRPKAKKKPKREKRRREEKGVFSLYKIDGNGVTLLRPTCERCGPGYFMADHGNRYTCGHCGFTRYRPTPDS